MLGRFDASSSLSLMLAGGLDGQLLCLAHSIYVEEIRRRIHWATDDRLTSFQVKYYGPLLWCSVLVCEDLVMFLIAREPTLLGRSKTGIRCHRSPDDAVETRLTRKDSRLFVGLS